MEKRVTVLYQQGLAHYDVKDSKNGYFIARLIKYSGKEAEGPPPEIEMHKEGRHWKDDGAKQDLVDDIGLAIEYEERPEQPILHQRGAESSRDSEREIRGGKP